MRQYRLDDLLWIAYWERQGGDHDASTGTRCHKIDCIAAGGGMGGDEQFVVRLELSERSTALTPMVALVTKTRSADCAEKVRKCRERRRAGPGGSPRENHELALHLEAQR
jgi:hypothetical protein